MSHTKSLSIWGMNSKTEVGGFVVIGREDKNGGCAAYVANREDARLYVAAPELLEALMRLVEDLEVRSVKGVVDCSDGVYQRARAAISKATSDN